MIKIQGALGVALLCTTLAAPSFAGQATAAGPVGDAAVTKTRTEGAAAPSQPSVKTLDDNAQREHDRNAATKPPSGVADARVAANGVRDWKAIDTNHDNLISPAEMEAALKPIGPQVKGQDKAKPAAAPAMK
ncbi:MAG: hypothetical protein ABIV63_13365 [Caldimonas sp.]